MLEIDDLDVRNGQSLAEELATNPGKACRTVGGNQLQTARLIIRIYSSSALHRLSNSRSRGAGRVDDGHAIVHDGHDGFTAEAVLQATTRSLMPCSCSLAVACVAYLAIDAGLLVP